MVVINQMISLIMFNDIGLNAAIKTEIVRVDQKTQLYVPHKKNPLQIQRHISIKSKGWREIYHANMNQRKLMSKQRKLSGIKKDIT